jgi:DNA primase
MMKVNLKKLSDWGINVAYENAKEVLCFCPFHSNTDTPAFSINKMTGLWCCFNESCGKRGNLRDLARELGFKLENHVRDISTDEIQELLEDEEEETFPQGAIDKVVLDYSSEEDLAKVQYLIDRGFSPAILQHFEVGFSEKKERIVIPARDENYRLLGFIGRAIRDEQRPKYLYTKGFGRAHTLWNLNNAKHYNEVIVVEGSLDAIKVHQAGFPNVVSTLGAAITDHHIDLLHRHFYKIIVFSDNDEAGKAARDGIIDRVPDRDLWVVEYPDTDMKDPGDLSEDEIREAIRSSHDYLTWVFSQE